MALRLMIKRPTIHLVLLGWTCLVSQCHTMLSSNDDSLNGGCSLSRKPKPSTSQNRHPCCSSTRPRGISIRICHEQSRLHFPLTSQSALAMGLEYYASAYIECVCSAVSSWARVLNSCTLFRIVPFLSAVPSLVPFLPYIMSKPAIEEVKWKEHLANKPYHESVNTDVKNTTVNHPDRFVLLR